VTGAVGVVGVIGADTARFAGQLIVSAGVGADGGGFWVGGGVGCVGDVGVDAEQLDTSRTAPSRNAATPQLQPRPSGTTTTSSMEVKPRF
jgi:hypothetical protein